MFETAFMT